MNELSPDPDQFSPVRSQSADFEHGTEATGAPIRIHGNSGPMRAVKRLRRELLAHLGKQPSPVQMAMVDQAAEIKLRLAVMDQAFRQTGRRSAHATRDYLAWSNSFTRLLRQFGLKASIATGPTLAEILASAPPRRTRAAPAEQPATPLPPTPHAAPAPPETAA